MAPNKTFEAVKEFLYNRYGHNPSKILVHTGVIGWVLSSMAQIGAILVNDKLTSQQKSYMVPQEAADALVNIGSFLVVTQFMTRFSKELVKTGKLRTPKISEFINKHNLFKKNGTSPAAGEFRFNLRPHIVNSGDIATLKKYDSLKNGVGIVGTAIGSILSCNIITPIIRNQIAARQQRKILETHDKIYNNYYQKNKDRLNLKIPNGITMDQYQNMAYRNFSSSNLKV